MLIAHASDTHSRHDILLELQDFDGLDLIILSGDMLPNAYLNQDESVDAQEIRYQTKWFRDVAPKWVAAARGVPFLCVAGNHDYIDIVPWLRHFGAEAYGITDKNPSVELLGKRFAGFRQINWIVGEWQGEEHDLAPFVDKAFDCDPDILVTHAPPAGILDTVAGYGVRPLTAALQYRPHRITHHFFGHCHADGGKVAEEMGIKFINGAGKLRIHEVD